MNSLAWMLVGATLATLVTTLVLRSGSRRPGANETRQVSHSADLAELNRDRRRSTEIIERMAEGVVVLNEALTPVLANTSARALLGLPETSLPISLQSDEVAAVARRALDEDAGVEEIVQVWFPARMALRVHAAPIEDRGVVVVLQDVTQELLTQKIRREFAASASHELKTPVASLQALGEALQRAAPDDPEVTVRFAKQVVAETERLSRLIYDLLDLSKLEEAVDAPRRLSDLSAISKEVVGDLNETIDDAEISLSLDVAPAIAVRGDEQQLALMLRNLVDNAIRYTPAQGQISVGVFEEGDSAVVRVSDTGPGIPAEAQERIFERFYRVDQGRSRDKGGTGLGLAIVKHVVELHGGRISLESRLGEGTTFEVRLPSAAAGKAQPIATAR